VRTLGQPSKHGGGQSRLWPGRPGEHPGPRLRSPLYKLNDSGGVVGDLDNSGAKVGYRVAFEDDQVPRSQLAELSRQQRDGDSSPVEGMPITVKSRRRRGGPGDSVIS
jgi:hypothetical protein